MEAATDLQLHVIAEYFTFLLSWFMGMPALLGFAFLIVVLQAGSMCCPLSLVPG